MSNQAIFFLYFYVESSDHALTFSYAWNERALNVQTINLYNKHVNAMLFQEGPGGSMS